MINQKFKIAFLGSDQIALPFLNEWRNLVPNSTLSAVLTQPDRPAGRGRKLKRNPITNWAEQMQLPLRCPSRPGIEELVWLEKLKIDLLLVMAYGHILSQSMLELAPFGCFNLHASILPAYRGASPIESALAMGESQTGVTLMRVIRKMDAGPIADQEKVLIDSSTTATELRNKLAQACIPLIRRNLEMILQGRGQELNQEERNATYCRKLTKKDGILDFSLSAEQLACRVRAFCEWPGSVIICKDEPIKVADAVSLEKETTMRTGEVGRDPSGDLLIGTSSGILKIGRLQKPGGKMMAAKEFLLGYDLPIGAILPTKTGSPLLSYSGRF